jgi:predicted transcriptional regulator of viral defense system
MLTGMNDHSLRIALTRLSNRGIIKRISRGFYANPFNIPTLEEVSGQIYQPSYISLESALFHYGILSQIPQILTCITTRFPRTFRSSLGIIEYRQIRSDLFWGFIRMDGYFLAEAEKALLDYMYLNRSKDIEDLFSHLDLARINKKKLKSISKMTSIPNSLKNLIKVYTK